MSAGKRLLILGLGNDVLSDDRVGLLAARRLATAAGGKADVAEAYVANLDLLPIIEGYERVVVLDALHAPGSQPGAIARSTASEMPQCGRHRSPHTMDFADILEVGKRLGLDMPREAIVYALVVVDPFRFGDELSPGVEEGLHRLVEQVLAAELHGHGLHSTIDTHDAPR